MRYTDISQFKEEAKKASRLDRAPSISEAKIDTSYFAANFLGITPYTWQYVFWKNLDSKNKRLIAVTSRQIGKSMALAIFALRATTLNIFPAGLTKKTHIGIISATDEQSKKIMLEIRRLINVGDDFIYDTTKGKTQGYFSKQLDSSPEAANNKTTITMSNGCTITCLPPTDRVRGYSFSYVFVDEAAFISDPIIFFQCIEPTVSKTDGTIVMTSTPNGQQGFVYELFDPEEKLSIHEYERLWIHYTSIDDEEQIKKIEEKKRFFIETGREKEFQQEYDALFTAQVSAFFESKDVDAAIDISLLEELGSKEETSLGVDFGMVNSNTVISISKKKGKNIYLLYQYIYPPGRDDALIEDILKLKNQFNSSQIVVDDCPEGFYIIKKLEQIGVFLIKMSFRTEKVEKYYSFRSMLRQNRIKMYKCDELIKQMKSMQQIQTASTVKIEKPSGGKDDCVDSLLMSCYPYLELENMFSSENIIYSTPVINYLNPRSDRFLEVKKQELEDLQEERKLWR